MLAHLKMVNYQCPLSMKHTVTKHQMGYGEKMILFQLQCNEWYRRQVRPRCRHRLGFWNLQIFKTILIGSIRDFGCRSGIWCAWVVLWAGGCYLSSFHPNSRVFTLKWVLLEYIGYWGCLGVCVCMGVHVGICCGYGVWGLGMWVYLWPFYSNSGELTLKWVLLAPVG